MEIVSTRQYRKKKKVVVVAERFKFSKRNQGENETIKNYVKDLKKLAATCEFGGFLEDALRDKFVFGIKDEKMQESLLQEDFTFDEALNFALQQHKKTMKSDKKGEFKEEVSDSEDLEELKYSLVIKDELTPFELQDEFEEAKQEFVYLQCEPKLPPVIEKEPFEAVKKQFRCDFCGYVFSTNSHLTRHVRTHTGEKPYVCLTCNAGFTRREGLQRHVKKSSNCEDYDKQVVFQKLNKTAIKVEHICDMCSRPFLKKSHLKRHLRIHTGEKPYGCPICKNSFTRSENLRQHMKTHEMENDPLLPAKPKVQKPIKPQPEEKTYKCKDCSQIFSKKLDLQNHLKDDIDNKICDSKDERFNAEEGEEDGEAKIENREVPSSQLYKCYNCDYTTPVKNHLRGHVKIHFGIKPFLCHICDYKSSRNSYLQIHIRRHDGVKKFACELCKFKSVSYSNLKRHLQIHTGQKSHICEVCGYKTNSSSWLKVHSRIHTGEKPFACSICNYRSAERTALRNHVRIHTGEKPFCCKFCDYRAAQRTGLAYHLKTHKKEQEKLLLENVELTLEVKEDIKNLSCM